MGSSMRSSVSILPMHIKWQAAGRLYPALIELECKGERRPRRRHAILTTVEKDIYDVWERRYIKGKGGQPQGSMGSHGSHGSQGSHRHEAGTQNAKCRQLAACCTCAVLSLLASAASTYLARRPARQRGRRTTGAKASTHVLAASSFTIMYRQCFDTSASDINVPACRLAVDSLSSKACTGRQPSTLKMRLLT